MRACDAVIEKCFSSKFIQEIGFSERSKLFFEVDKPNSDFSTDKATGLIVWKKSPHRIGVEKEDALDDLRQTVNVDIH